jgi:dipeptidyl-peptidase 4
MGNDDRMDPGIKAAVDGFPRQYSRTRRFTLGRPRSFSVAPDGSRVLFLRSRAGDDAMNCLWALDVDTAEERLIADPRELLGEAEEELSPEERARRERARESAEGIVSYATDREFRIAAIPLGGRLFVSDPGEGSSRELEVVGTLFDPRPDPSGLWVAYVSDGALRVRPIDDSGPDRVLAGEDHPDISWGMAEFVAAEEMDRLRGYWWSPDGSAIAAARVDVGPVQRWYLGDPANPEVPPFELAYPVAGTANADVTLHVLGLDGRSVDVDWDRGAFEYLVAVDWSDPGGLTLLVQSRDQKEWHVLTVDPQTGKTESVWRDRDEKWLDIVEGVPAWTGPGSLAMTTEREDTRRLLIGGRVVTKPGLHVRRVVDAGGEVLFTATNGEESEQMHVWRVAADGSAPVRLTTEPGVHTATADGGTVVIESLSLDRDSVRVSVWRKDEEVAEIRSLEERAVLTPNVTLLRAGARRIPTALVLPTNMDPGRPLPVLMNPYGGPHVQRVIHARNAYLEAQWFAEQGFAVVIVDGRGTPGLGMAWEKSIYLDIAGPVLEDQVDALHAVAEQHPQLDLSRVAIRGWSFGGSLTLLAVLRRPDVFHAGIAGAPVTDERLYDTHYNERYLGRPQDHPDAYEHNSPLMDAAKLERPLLLIHGLADDNVVAANTLRFSKALLEAGRPHRVLPLAGITHMTPKLEEHLLGFELQFLREALGLI